MPEVSMSIKGIYRDVLRDARGKVTSDTGWKSNLIVLSCRVLLAGLMKSEQTETPLGIQSLKVGRGSPTWDTVSTPAPDDTLTGLVDPSPFTITREGLELIYLDASGQLSSKPTSRIEIIAKLGPNQPPPEDPSQPKPYPLREFGLFGKLNGEDYMIDYIRHHVIEKDNALTLERHVQLIF
jgi:hypothetical protein